MGLTADRRAKDRPSARPAPSKIRKLYRNTLLGRMAPIHYGEALGLFLVIAVPLPFERACRTLAWLSSAMPRPFFLTLATARPPVPHTAEITLPGLVTAILAFSSKGKVSSVDDPNRDFQRRVRNPCSSRLTARTLRSWPVASPRTTATSL